MALIHVCPLAHVETTLRSSQASSVLSLLTLPARAPIPPGLRHLNVAISDITEATPDRVLAETGHVEDLLLFLRAWDRRQPLLIHCYAGVSRSTAAAFIALCALDPAGTEHEHAARLRASSPTATPNRHLVALADAQLGRAGRMIAAIADIGRGVECFEGTCFALTVPDSLEIDAPTREMV